MENFWENKKRENSKIKIENGKVIKDDHRLMLDCSSIAKGYGVDRVAQTLDKKGVEKRFYSALLI